MILDFLLLLNLQCYYRPKQHNFGFAIDDEELYYCSNMEGNSGGTECGVNKREWKEKSLRLQNHRMGSNNRKKNQI